MSADQDVPTTYAEAAWERGAATAEEHGRPREEVTPAAESGGNDEAGVKSYACTTSTVIIIIRYYSNTNPPEAVLVNH